MPELTAGEAEVLGKLLPLVQEVTGVREDRIRMDSNLVMDLGAESIDLLDLSFLIEETFRVSIQSDEFEQEATAKMGGRPYERNGVLTDEALEQLRLAMPEVPGEHFKPGLRKLDVASVLNVAVFVHMVQRKLQTRQKEASNA